MGITIFAKGKIDRIEDLPRLIDDLKDVAGKRNWKYRVIDDDSNARPNTALTHGAAGRPGVFIEGSLGLKGVILTVPGAEMFAVLFDRSGVLTDMFQETAFHSQFFDTSFGNYHTVSHGEKLIFDGTTSAI